MPSSVSSSFLSSFGSRFLTTRLRLLSGRRRSELPATVSARVESLLLHFIPFAKLIRCQLATNAHVKALARRRHVTARLVEQIIDAVALPRVEMEPALEMAEEIAIAAPTHAPLFVPRRRREHAAREQDSAHESERSTAQEPDQGRDQDRARAVHETLPLSAVVASSSGSRSNEESSSSSESTTWVGARARSPLARSTP